MAMAGLPAFSEGEVDGYVERLNSYFIVSKTKDEHKVHVLVAGLPAGTYGVLRDLCSPRMPSEMAFDELTKLLKDHYGGSTNPILERQKFRQVERRPDEKVNEYVVRLRKAARGCDFKTNLSENLVEQFRRGINHSHIASCLVRIPNDKQFDLDTVLKMAVEAELYADGSSGTASKDKTEILSDGIHRIGNTTNRQPRQGKDKDVICFRCNRRGHIGSDPSCQARGRTCNTCKRRGHFSGSKYCTNSSSTQKVCTVGSEETTPTERSNTQFQENQLFTIGEASTSTKCSQQIAGVSSGMPKVQLSVAGKTVTFLIDSGACANIIDIKTYDRIHKDATLIPTSRELFAYGSNTRLDLKGEINTNVACAANGRVVSTKLYVFSNATMCLLSYETARDLGILSINDNVVYAVSGCHKDIVDRFPKVFEGVGKLKDVSVKFHVDHSVPPVAQPVRRLPFGYREKVKQNLDNLLANDIIEPVEGVGTSWVSPLVCVMKDSGEIRQTIDMRLANKAILRERHPVPTVKEMLAGLEGAKVFSKLDLNQGFHQVELDPNSRDITTFITPFGLFRYKRLIQGANASPEIFQHVIRQTLVGLEGVQNLADDIILYGSSAEEHDRRLHSLLCRLEQVGLTLNGKKCAFRMSSIRFLGFIVSAAGISADPSKVESIVNFRRPDNVTDCRSFLGLVNFVGRFLPNLATISEPLRRITHKDQAFKWTNEQQKAFELIKNAMSQAQTLAHFDPQAATRVVADASPYGLGAILIQTQGASERIVSYGHRSLSAVERKYSQTEKEALALVWACEHFMLYLLGTEFELVTDHKPLDFIFNSASSKPTPRIERWALRLQSFRYKVVHKPGKCNLADPLSRLSISTNAEYMGKQSIASVVAEQYINIIARESVPCALTWSEIASATKDCLEIQSVIRAVERSDFKSCALSYQSIKEELSVCDGVLLRNNKIVVPLSLRPRCVELAHEGHQGIVKSKQRLRSKLWWPKMDYEAEKFCRKCMDCVKVSAPDPPEPMSMSKFPSKPWQQLSCDLLGPLPDGRSVIAVIDYYSKYFECAFLRSTTADKVIEFLDTVFSRFGFPDSLRTDNGPQFVSDVLRKYMHDCGIRWVSTTPLWPQANGEIERTNRTLLKTLKIAKLNNLDMSVELRKFLMAYRSTPHSSTGVAPYTLLFGRDMKTKLPSVQTTSADIDRTLHDKAADNDALKKLSSKLNVEGKNGAVENQITVGDSVYLKQPKQSKLDANFGNEKFYVTGRVGSEIVCENAESGSVVRRNVSFAKRCVESNDHNCAQSGQSESHGGGFAGKCTQTQPLVQRSRAPPLRFGNPVSH